MAEADHRVQHLLSLPPAMAADFERVTGLDGEQWVAAADPPGGKLGSGGGVAHLLVEGWRRTGEGVSFERWLCDGPQKVLLMAGGESRRLPAYAAEGKLMMPLPVMRWAVGQRLGQTLLDELAPLCREVLLRAGRHYRVAVASGDVLLRFDPPASGWPEADVLGLGMWVRPEMARYFGVFFSPRRDARRWSFLLQKPEPSRIRELAEDYFYLVDSGLWLLSGEAVRVLMAKCGWDGEAGCFFEGRARPYELYAGMGLALGDQPACPDSDVGGVLTAAVMPLSGAGFYHLGSSRQMIESVSELQNLQLDQTLLGVVAAQPHPDQFVLNSVFEYPRRLDKNHTLWVESSHVPAGWKLEHDHVITGVPRNGWQLKLPAGACLDFVPVGEALWCVRFYGMDDGFRGELGCEDTIWMGRPAVEWFKERGIGWEEAGLAPLTDLQSAKLFPVLAEDELAEGFVQWMLGPLQEAGQERDLWRARWLECERLSAAEIGERFCPLRRMRQRRGYLAEVLPGMAVKARRSPFYRLDLEDTAAFWVEHGVAGLPEPRETAHEAVVAMHKRMFRSAVMHLRGEEAAALREEEGAFGVLREAILGALQAHPVMPRATLLEDQIVWGRSPVRIDLAGGWTDTPPYCLEHGGRVVNVAISLNGQQPVQVFARLCEVPEIVVRSIDLGVETRLRSYEELADYAQPGSGFALAKAALAVCGFLPQFHAAGGYGSLERDLEVFGGGLEISMLAAVPKGSGLGTSSILGATLLGVLSEVCGFGWEHGEIYRRTIAVEQLLTTGGGWQDQIGGVAHGAKLIETLPGLDQNARLRWAPERVLTEAIADGRVLLFYTGLTRMAKNLLHEVVRKMFLNSRDPLWTLREIGNNALAAHHALQSGSWQELVQCASESWRLKKKLDAGSSTPELERIIAGVRDWTVAEMLPGAGGGGYIVFFTKDAEAGRRLREELTSNPPNRRARFVDFAVDREGLRVTRS